MERITSLTAFEDTKGNRIEYGGESIEKNINITFKGSNNTLIVRSPCRIGHLSVAFDCNNGVVDIGENRASSGSFLRASIRLGEDCSVTIGRNVTMTSTCSFTAAEGTTISVGEDCMIASNNEIRSHDGHPIFDIDSGRRSNVAKSIEIGNHVWLAKDAVILAGAQIGDGTVIGHRAVVTRSIPNNCVAVGAPARVVRRNIAWERPNLTMTRPYYKPDASSVKQSKYWNHTAPEGQAPLHVSTVSHLGGTIWRRFRKLGGRLWRNLRRIG